MADNRHSVAQAVHDLGAALWFGGSVMGVAGVNKSGADLRDGLDKIRVAEAAWQRFAPAQWLGIGAVLLAGSRLTAASAGHIASDPGFARAGKAKVVASLAGAAATAFAAYSGNKIGELAELRAREQGGEIDTKDATIPNAQTPTDVAAWQSRQRIAQFVAPALAGAVIVLNARLVQGYRPTAALRGLADRLTPG
jgi:hypothetical protein